MHIAIVIGSYRLADYVQLNIRACRRVFPGADILISDDASRESAAIERVADEEGVAFIGSKRRRSHCSGDWQSYINGTLFARECGADVVVKLSQRMVPVLPSFRDHLVEPFRRFPEVRVVIPGPISKRTLARRDTAFYLHFPVLTDVVAWRPAAFDPEYLMLVYKDQCSKAVDQSTQHMQLAEHAWFRICSEQPIGSVVHDQWLSDPEPMKPKAYLRKAQSTRLEYTQLASELGVHGLFDVREWIRIEAGPDYLCRPPVT